jgi:hypothetical protein
MVSGIPTPSNANRTAQGVNAQLQGSSLRLYPIINNAEYGMIIPAISMAVKMTRMHMDRTGNLPGVIRNPENPEQTEQVGVTPEAFMQDSKVEVKAASKMLSRDRIMQYFQTLSQSLFTSQFQAELAKNGETLDFEEILACLYDATGMNRKYKFVRKYTQQEIQAQQEQQKAQAQAQQTPQEMQLKQMDQQTRLQLGEMKKETEHEKNVVDAQKNQPNPMEMELEKQKADLEKQMKQFDLQIKAQMAQLDFQIKQMELQMKAKESEMKIQSDQQKMANDAQMMQMKGAPEDRIASDHLDTLIIGVILMPADHAGRHGIAVCHLAQRVHRGSGHGELSQGVALVWHVGWSLLEGNGGVRLPALWPLS